LERHRRADCKPTRSVDKPTAEDSSAVDPLSLPNIAELLDYAARARAGSPLRTSTFLTVPSAAISAFRLTFQYRLTMTARWKHGKMPTIAISKTRAQHSLIHQRRLRTLAT
jgi:hypothetical protein